MLQVVLHYQNLVSLARDLEFPLGEQLSKLVRNARFGPLVQRALLVVHLVTHVLR